MGQLHLWGSRGGTGPGLGLGEQLLVGVSPLGGISHVVLSLAVLGKVQSSDLLSLFDLLLVGLDLALELVNQGLHPLMVLPVLILLVAQFLDSSLALPQVLLSIRLAPILGIHLRLQLPDAGVHLCHGLLAALQGVGLGLIHPSLHVLHLGLQKGALSLQTLGKVLLVAEFISKTSSINHGLLGLLLGEGGLRGHLIQISLKSSSLIVQLLLGSLDGLVGAGLLTESLVGISQLLLHHPPGTVCLLQEGAGLLKGILVGVCLLSALMSAS